MIGELHHRVPPCKEYFRPCSSLPCLGGVSQYLSSNAVAFDLFSALTYLRTGAFPSGAVITMTGMECVWSGSPLEAYQSGGTLLLSKGP